MDDIRKSLQEIHDELKLSDIVNKSSEADELLVTISDVLEHPGEVSFSHHRLLAERMKKAISHFEVSHPKLFGSLSVIIQSLNESGI